MFSRSFKTPIIESTFAQISNDFYNLAFVKQKLLSEVLILSAGARCILKIPSYVSSLNIDGRRDNFSTIALHEAEM